MINTISNFDKKTLNIIELTKSKSNSSGKILRDAHYKLGLKLAEIIDQEIGRDVYIVYVMMRSGLCLSLGIADKLEIFGKKVKVIFSHEKEKVQLFNEKSLIILVDGVINTGKSILEEIKAFKSQEVIIATNVISRDAYQNLKDFNGFTVRVSDNSFVGTNQKTIDVGKGPDTSERLFNSDFFKED